MRRSSGSSRKRSTLAGRMAIASVALILGGGGLVAVNVYASANEGQSGPPGSGQNSGQLNIGQQMSTISCPDVTNSLPDVPDQARPQVDRELAGIDTQITDAYEKFASNKDKVARDPGWADRSVLAPLKDSRAAAIDRIGAAIGRGGGQRPQGLQGLAPCSLRADDNGGAASANGQQAQGQGQWQGQTPGQGQDQGQAQTGGQGQGQGQGQNVGGQGQGSLGNGPSKNDFVDIRSVQPNVRTPRAQRGGSTGLFTSNCGVNQNAKRNPDNVIVAPGVSNGAHHMHDYVGNQATDAFSSDTDLANGGTSCSNQGDKSTYYWPVLRLQNGQNENDANADGGGKDQNVGKIQTPVQVTIKLAGSPVSKVTAMPRFLRIITGDAKAFTNGNANANASWSCTGFENRQLKDKYPICPQGSNVVRTFTFQSCWDGKNTDSANHRTHVAFALKNGACPAGFKAIPQLQQRIVYSVPPGPGFAVDSFPEQLHKPVTDHGDFIDVFSDSLMRKVVNCINTGRSCA
ncbi:DUF1996 domain-containing protein [Streptomyces sp. NPDC020719]|uniref:DUF1996 domain-containing protein n=1 Tax=Streptomyces sp. NPDC020719 TaxID=3154896 RepID=UPI0033FAD0D3